MFELIEIERLEKKYLDRLYYFFKLVEDDMLDSFQTGKKIENDWKELWGGQNGGISNFSIGFERVVYNYLNGKAINFEVNSSPVASDLFFENNEVFIHIDIKTVQARNIGDISTSIFIGLNQNSYRTELKTAKGKSFEPIRVYSPALPTIYNRESNNPKLCLTYFFTILYDDISLNILNINIISMPNGLLESHYKSRPLKAGKLTNEARFNFQNVNKYEILDNSSRIKVIYFDKTMNSDYKKSLNFIYNILKNGEKL
jgi:hypothetical protein